MIEFVIKNVHVIPAGNVNRECSLQMYMEVIASSNKGQFPFFFPDKRCEIPLT